MRFSYNWLQSYFKKPLPKPDGLAELLNIHSFEVEGIEKANGVKDSILDIDILPNRVSDAASHLGIAGECAVVLDYTVIKPSFKPKTANNLDTKDFVSVQVKDKKACPRYMALLIQGAEVKPSPKWLQDRLVATGQKPINNIVDAANYVMLETGQPLHAFDRDKLGGHKIVVRPAEEGENITTLDNKEVKLKEGMLIIADESDPLVIAGIKGGKKAEVTKETKDIILEAAVFDPVMVRLVSKAVGIRTDASYRFEHEVSYFMPEVAIQRAAVLIQELAGGKVAINPVDISGVKPKQTNIFFTEDDVAKMLGTKVKSADITGILKKLGFSVSKEKDGFIAVPPIERTDIAIKQDIIEEIIRVYGYKNIVPEMPKEILLPSDQNDEYFYSNEIRDFLVSAGFSEVCNYSFTDKGSKGLKLKNSMSPTKAYLRENLLRGLEQTLENNLKNFDVVKIFEVGKTFRFKDGDITEGVRVGGSVGYKNKKVKQEDVFLETKGAVEILLNKLGIMNIWFSEGEGGITIIETQEHKVLGYIEKLNISKAFAFEFDLKKIIEEASGDVEFNPISKFPAVARDISLFTAVDARVAEVMNIIENAGGELLVDTDLFDIYVPDDVMPAGNELPRKSLAFRLIFQSHDKTLTDKEVNKVRDKIIKALEENGEWEVRR